MSPGDTGKIAKEGHAIAPGKCAVCVGCIGAKMGFFIIRRQQCSARLSNRFELVLWNSWCSSEIAVVTEKRPTLSRHKGCEERR